VIPATPLPMMTAFMKGSGEASPPPASYASSNWSRLAPQTGQTQSSGSSLKGVLGGMPLSGSPTAGS
jgi:hypothetical protein